MPLLYHAYVYLEFLILVCTIYILAPEVVLWSDAQAKMMSAIQSSTMPDMNVVSDTSWSSAYLAGGIVEVDDIVETVDNEQDFIDSTLLSWC